MPSLPAPPVIADAPIGLPPTPSPAHNPTTPEKVALGRLLFFDERLSVNRTMSCASCHAPEKGWADGRVLALTVGGALNRRHTPSLLNIGYHSEYYWDGRMATMEAQILANWRGQMAADPEAVAALFANIPVYQAMFERAFAEGPSASRIAEALASYVRTIRSGRSPWDRYEAGEAHGLSQDAVAGAKVFSGRAGCAFCHPPPLYTDLSFHKIGVPEPELSPDPGRFLATKSESDRGAFKTPGLRGLARTAPYFHNGTAQTLDEVLALKLRSAPRTLSATEVRQLSTFLQALSPAASAAPAPDLPPDPITEGDGGVPQQPASDAAPPASD